MASNFSHEKLSEIDARLSLVSAHQNYRPGSLERRLVDILNGYITLDSCLVSRGRKLNRTEIAKQLHVTKSALTRHLNIFDAYERALRTEAYHVTRIPEMKLWLDAGVQAGTLETFNNRQVKRKQFFEAFGISGSTLLAYPQIAEVLEPYDNLIERGEYLPKVQSEKLRWLRERCSSEEFLGKSRAYAYGKAAAILDLTEEQLRRRPYSTEINQILKSLRAERESDPFVVSETSRDFSFRFLIDLAWNHSVVKRTVAAMANVFATLSLSWSTRLFAALSDFASWLFRNNSRHVRQCFDMIRCGRGIAIDAGLWAETHSDYGAATRARYSNVRTRDSSLVATNSVFNALSFAGILPDVAIPFRKEPRGRRRHLPSIAEALPKGKTQRNNLSYADQYIEFATQKFSEAATLGHGSGEDQVEFLSNLRMEIERENIPSNIRPDEAVTRILRRRLDLLKSAFAVRLANSRAKFEYGQKLLSNGISPELYWGKLFGPNVKRQNISNVLRSYFPLHENEASGVSNLLALVKERYGGIYPANDKSDRPEGAFFIKRAREYGGLPLLQSYLLPDIDAVGSILALFQIETGSNVAVARTLTSTCTEPSQIPKHLCITGFKERAQGKPIFNDLPLSSPAARGIEWLKSAAEPVRQTLQLDERNCLAVVRLHGGVKPLADHAYRDYFKAVVSEIPELSDLNLTPSMIRPTVILLDTLSRSGTLKTALAIGQHSVAENQGYSDKFPVRLLRDRDIRDFGDLFEAAVLDGNEKAIAFAGISSNDFEARLKRATKTGVGILCGDRYARPGHEGKQCQAMDCWNKCPQIIFIARKHDVALLQLWQRALKEFEPEWISDRPERWASVWLPWLEFANVLESKLRVRYEAIWREASVIADQIVANPIYQPFRIF